VTDAVASVDLLRQLDDDPLGAADVTEPVAVLVANQLADELGAPGPQALDDGVDVVDEEGEVAEALGVRGRVGVAGLGRRRVELHELDFSMAGRVPQHRELHLDPVEGDDALYPLARDLALASRLQAELDEEVDRGLEVVDHDADVFHLLDPHGLDSRGTSEARPDISVCFGVTQLWRSATAQN